MPVLPGRCSGATLFDTDARQVRPPPTIFLNRSFRLLLLA
jgi:hypothetical protein